jgi:hypothetical protein
MSLILSGTEGLSDVDSSAATPAIRGTDANTGIFFPAADTIAFAEGGAECARFDSSGNFGLGTSSPAKKLQINSSDTTDGIRLYCADTGGENLSIVWQSAFGSNRITGDIKSNASGAGGNFILRTANTSAVLTEALRVDNAQNLLVGTSSLSTSERLNVTYAPANTGIVVNTSSTPVSNSVLIDFLANGTRGGVIVFTNLGVTTAYVTSSDYRLKENIQPMTGALAKVAQLKPVTYKWKNNGSNSDGFIAHELAEVCPQAVNGEKDAVNEDGSINPQGIDTSFLVATLTAAIQEQQALITTLTARISALESA